MYHSIECSLRWLSVVDAIYINAKTFYSSQSHHYQFPRCATFVVCKTTICECQIDVFDIHWLLQEYIISIQLAHLRIDIVDDDNDDDKWRVSEKSTWHTARSNRTINVVCMCVILICMPMS